MMSPTWGPFLYGCLLHLGWAANISRVYVALNDPLLLSIPGYPNAERDQVTWRGGNETLMGKFKNSSSYNQTKGCECELFRNGSLYLKRLGTVGNENYTVTMYNQIGIHLTTVSILVTVIEKVSAPRLNSSCSPDGRALIGCEVEGGTDPQYSWEEDGGNLSPSWNVSGNWMRGFAPVPVTVSCSVWNPVSEERSQRVSVFCPLPVSVPSLAVRCQQDGSARIFCQTDSGTDPVFSWRVNGADRQGDPSISGNGTWSQISVPPPAVGNTLCAVSNTISNGSSTQSFSCPGLSYSDVPRVHVLLGQSFSLVPGQNLRNSSYQYHWRKGSLTLGKTRHGVCVYGCGETSMIFSNGTFWKSQAEREDEGTYSVDVYNGFGVHFHREEIFLQIIGACPTQGRNTDQPKYIVQVALGESAILPPCRTAPEEPYEAQWRKGAELLQKLHKGSCIGDCGERYRVLPNGSLWLGPVQQGDGGTYSVELYDVSGHRIHRAEIFLQINNETPGGAETSGGRPSFPTLILICAGVLVFMVLITCMVGALLYKSKRKQRGAGHKASAKPVVYAHVKCRNHSAASQQVTWCNRTETPRAAERDPRETGIYMDNISTFRDP